MILSDWGWEPRTLPYSRPIHCFLWSDGEDKAITPAEYLGEELRASRGRNDLIFARYSWLQNVAVLLSAGGQEIAQENDPVVPVLDAVEVPPTPETAEVIVVDAADSASGSRGARL
jgi:hypothetical protein